MWMIALGGGCVGSPLAEAPIVGGSAEQQSLVRAVAADFEGAVGEGRVRVRRIVLQQVPGLGAEGNGYSRFTRDVTLLFSADVPLSVGSSLRDSLGRALAYQEHLDAVDPEPISAVAELLCPQWHGCDDPEEIFAGTVGFLAQQSPYWAAAVGDGCAGAIEDAPAMTEDAAAWMLTHVWSAFAPPAPLALGAAVDAGTDDVAAVIPTTDPRVIKVITGAGGGWDADLYTGEEVQSEATAVPSAADVPLGLGLVFSGAGQYAGWEDGPALLVGQWSPVPLQETSGSRILGHDGARWAFVGDACATGDERAFTADGQVWLAHPAGWAPLVP